MRAIRFTLLALAVLFPCGPLGAQPKDNYGDPLPEGAKARIGTTRMYRAGGVEWTGAALTPDGKFLLSPLAAGAVERLDVATGLPVDTIGEKDPQREARDRIILSADGKRALSVNASAFAVWDTQTGRELTRAAAPVNWQLLNVISPASLSADGTTLAFGLNENAPITVIRGSRQLVMPREVVVWTVGETKKKLTLETEQIQSVSVSLSPNGKILATWGQLPPNRQPNVAPVVPDSPIQFWDATNGKKLGTFTVPKVKLAEVAFTPDNKLAAVIGSKGLVVLIDPSTGRESKALSVPPSYGGRLLFSPDGQTLAIGSANGAIILWDIAADKKLSTTMCPMKIPSGGVNLVFTDEKRVVAWAVQGSKAVVWEAPSGKLLSPSAGASSGPNSLAFADDGKELLTSGGGSSASEVQRWNPASGELLGTVALEAPGSNKASSLLIQKLFPSAKAHVSTGTFQYLYDANTGKPLHNLYRVSQSNALYLCADGEAVIISTDAVDITRPRKASVFELATGKSLCEIELPPGILYGTPVRTRDGKKLMTITYTTTAAAGQRQTDFVVRLWDLATGKKLGEIVELDVGGGWVTLTPRSDGTSAYMTDSKKGLRLLDFSTEKVSYEINTGGFTPSAGPVLSPDGKWFAVGLCDPARPGRMAFDVRIYDAESGQPLKTFRGHKGLVNTLAFSPDGKALASASHDTTVLLWDLTTIDKSK